MSLGIAASVIVVGCGGGSSSGDGASSGHGASSGDGASSSDGTSSVDARTVPPFPRFADITATSGVTFRHDNGFDGTSYRIVETVNGGVGLLDFDGDGHLDIYFTNARRLRHDGAAPRNALYRGNGDGTFVDVSARSGTDDDALTLGCSIADVDGDGRPDIYVTNDGPNRLYRNLGGGRFEDIAARSGVAGGSMAAGSAFLDMDGDGDLDLYVASYAVDAKTDQSPAVVRGAPSYWPPLNYAAAADHLYENRGDGTFADVSATSGIRAVDGGRGLGVLTADIDGDGEQDIYVANDMTANFFFKGDGEGKFEELGLELGTATGFEGDDQGSMGVALGDYDRDGMMDLFVTNYLAQTNNLFRAVRPDLFQDVAQVAGVSLRNRQDVSWGVGFVDFDADGWRDLFVVNGHLNPHTEKLAAGTSYPQRDRLWRNRGDGGFAEVTDDVGDLATLVRVGRGAAFGDIDNDGDVDIIIVHSSGPPAILRNDGDGGGSWAMIRLLGAARNRDAIGARVTVLAGGARQTFVRSSAASYVSADDPRIHVGLGAAGGIERIDVRWADGSTQTWTGLPARRLIVLEQGEEGFEVTGLAGVRNS